jgi:bifunctional DNase/RNase
VTTDIELRLVDMKIDKVVGIRLGNDDPRRYVVLSEGGGDREMAIQIGVAEATSLAATVQGVDLGRPHGAHVTAAVVRALGGQVRRVRIDRVVDEVYVATVELDGASGNAGVDARPSDALNLAALVACPISVATEVLDEAARRREEVSAEGERLRLAPNIPPMTLTRREPLDRPDSP